MNARLVTMSAVEESNTDSCCHVSWTAV